MAIGVVVDVSGAINAQLVPHCDDLMRSMIALLKDVNAHRDLKPLVFSCFGDVALAVGAGFAPISPSSQ